MIGSIQLCPIVAIDVIPIPEPSEFMVAEMLSSGTSSTLIILLPMKLEWRGSQRAYSVSGLLESTLRCLFLT